jgi:protein-tyrosine phosphatase
LSVSAISAVRRWPKASCGICPVDVDSAGTGGWHIGDLPDHRSIAIARHQGIDISGQRGRKIDAGDFEAFDLIFAMDRNNLATLRALAPPAARHKLHLFRSYTLGAERDVPDPYHGGPEDFETVYSMLFEGCSSLIGRLEVSGS